MSVMFKSAADVGQHPPNQPPSSSEVGGGPPGAPAQMDIFALLAPLWRRKWIIALLALIGAGLGALYTVNSDDRYTATARVIFEPERLRIIDLGSVVANPGTQRSAMQNEIEVLRSALLLDRVIDTLRLHRAPEFNPDIGGYEETLLQSAFQRVPWPGIIAEQLRKLALLPPLRNTGETPEEREQWLRNHILAKLDENLTLRPIGESRVIEISYTSTNPTLAPAIVNATGEQYIIVQTERKRDDIAQATEMLGTRVRELENRMNRADEALQMAEVELALGAEYGSALISQQIESVNAALADAALERTAVEQRYARASSALANNADLYTIPEFRASPIIAGFRARETELLDQSVSMRSVVANDSNPTLVRLQARLNEVQRNMAVEAERIIAGLAGDLEAAVAREEQLAENLADLEVRALEQARAEMRLARLNREAQSVRNIYETFFNRMNETMEQAALQSPEARFLTRATRPLETDRGSEWAVIIGSTGLGIALAVAIILLIEQFNASFRRSAEVEERTGLNVLAGIPKLGRRKAPKQLLGEILANPSGHLAESARNLRTSILFSNIDQAPKVIMFASSVPGEGKTTTAMLTAITSQQMERSAVIVDCDLRRTTLGSIFSRDAEQPGLFAALQGTASIEDAVYVEPETGLHVLAAERVGHRLGNPADILASRRFQRLISQLKARYDLVILDTPPVLAVADPRIVAQVADTVVYLVRWNGTKQGAVLEGLRDLTSVNAKIAGVAFTLVDERQAKNYLGAAYLYKRSYA